MIVSPERHTERLNQVLMAEKAALEADRSLIRQDMSDKEARLREIERRLAHVNGLLEDEPEAVALEQPPDRTSPRSNAVEIAYTVLSERNRQPMYYKDLAKEVASQGGDISGSNAAQILVARLVRDERFVRPVRKGFYALRDDYPNAPNVGARKRRRRAA